MSTLFNLYDYIFFAFTLFFALVGLARGFWVQLFSVIVWMIGAALYYSYGQNMEQGLLSNYLSPPIAHWFMLAIVLAACFFVNFIIRFLLGSLFKINAFTFFNKTGGLLFGVCGSALVVLLIIYAINNSSLSRESTDWKKSYVVTHATSIMSKLNEHNDNKIAFTVASPHTAVPQIGNTYEVA